MDELIKDIRIKYEAEAKTLMEPVNEVQLKITAMEKGIATTNQTFLKAKDKVKQLERDTNKAISESYDHFVIDRNIDETVTAKLKLETIRSAMDEANTNLEALKTERTCLQQDRAASLRDVIADSFGDFQALFFTHLEQVHKLAITWQALPDRLSQDYGDKYCKTSVVDNPIAPLSFGKFAADLKSIMQGVGSWESDHLGVNQKG